MAEVAEASAAELSALLELDDDPLLSPEVGGGRVGVEIQVDDEAWEIPVDTCEHDQPPNVQTLTAILRDEADGSYAGTQIRVRARCSGCGTPFDFPLEGTPPRDGGRGIVLAIHPSGD